METRDKILKALAEAGEPLRIGEIAVASGVSRQLVGYWIPELVRNGVVIPVRRLTVMKYQVQPALIEYNLTPGKLKELMAPLLEEVDFSHVEDSDIDNAVLDLIRTCILMNSDYFWDEDEENEVE